MEEKERGVFSSGCPGCRRAGACTGCARREPRGKLLATDWLADLPGIDPKGVVEVMFKNTRVGFYANTFGIPLKIGDIVAVEAAPGHDIGRVTMIGPLVALQMKKNGVKPGTELKKVFRIARPNDIEKFEEARAREHSTMIKSRSIAEELGLAMKIGDVEYQGDGGKAIFYYIADERVDFRKLIRILADTFKVRIEMKQIGARQEAGRIGGIGPCGRPLCCSSWMSKFVSVGTGAARMQDLSMNPQKLAGQCAKLKCCLNFEVDSYAEAQKQLPPKDLPLETKDGTYFYFKPDILARTITYSTDKNIPSNLVTISAARAFEIIALNKQGIKVDFLDPDSDEAVEKEYGDIIGQDSLTRFDKNRKKKKKKKKTSDTPEQSQDNSLKQPFVKNVVNKNDGNSDRQERQERQQRQQNRQDRPDRQDRQQDRPDRQDRQQDRPDRHDRQQDRPDRQDRQQDRPDRQDRQQDRPDRQDRQHQSRNRKKPKPKPRQDEE